MSENKTKTPSDNGKKYRNLIIRPFTYIHHSVGTESVVMLVLLGIQILMLALTKSFSAIAVICAAAAGSVIANFIDRKCTFLKPQCYFTYPISIVQGLVIGMLIPETYPPLTVFLITLLVMIIIKHFFGGFSYSLVNPSVFAVAVLWLAGAYLFGQIELTADMLTSRNPSQQLIESGIFPTAAFDSSVTETLNNAIFSLFKVSIPDGYASLFWDTHSVIPAFRFNLVTLVSSIVLFSMDGMKIVISSFFLAVYLLLIRFVSPVFFQGIPFQGDMLLALLTGGTLFTATFVLNWYGTVPSSLNGKIIYGILAGTAAFFIAGCGTSPAGMAFTVLLINFASILIQFYENDSNIRHTKKLVELSLKGDC